MSGHGAIIEWSRGDQDFADRKYSRAHVWSFDGGAAVPGSSSPLSVRPPLSDPAAVDPEEAMIASLSSCHMLWFLDFAARAGLIVDTYVDAAEGEMGRNDAGHSWLARVTLNPVTSFSGRQPDQVELDHLHHEAHVHCDMANSVKTAITLVATLG